jgi:hypothetical protein
MALSGDDLAALRAPTIPLTVLSVLRAALIARELVAAPRPDTRRSGVGTGSCPLAVGHMLHTATFDVTVSQCAGWRCARCAPARGVGGCSPVRSVASVCSASIWWCCSAWRWSGPGGYCAAGCCGPGSGWPCSSPRRIWPGRPCTPGRSCPWPNGSPPGRARRIGHCSRRSNSCCRSAAPRDLDRRAGRAAPPAGLAGPPCPGLPTPAASVIVLVTGGQYYYAVGLQLVLLAAGFLAAKRWCAGAPARRTLLTVAVAVQVPVAVAFALPVLPASASLLGFRRRTGGPLSDIGGSPGTPSNSAPKPGSRPRGHPDRSTRSVLSGGD